MTKHISFTLPRHRNGGMSGVYDIDMFQSSYDEIVICVQNALYMEPTIKQYVFPVRKKDGFSWKLNKQSVACDSGKAEDIINTLSRPEMLTFAEMTVEQLIFKNPKIDKLGL